MQGTTLLIFRRTFKEVYHILYDTTVGKVKHHKLPDVLNKYLFIDLFIFIYNFEKNHKTLVTSAAFVSICANLSL